MLWSMVLGCGASATPDAPPVEATKAVDPCALLSPAKIESITGAKNVEAGKPDSRQRRVMCSWTWLAGRVDLQVSTTPKPDQAWSSHMLAGKRDQGMVEEPGLGAEAVYGANSSQIFWRTDETTLYHVSLGGDRPGYVAPRETLRKLADAITSAL